MVEDTNWRSALRRLLYPKQKHRRSIAGVIIRCIRGAEVMAGAAAMADVEARADDALPRDAVLRALYDTCCYVRNNVLTF